MTTVRALLAKASAGLLFQSESDYPLTAWSWPAGTPFTPVALLAQHDLPAETPITTLTLAEFFRPLAVDQEWFEPIERERAAAFRRLQAVLERHLSDIQVYKLGTINIPVYIVGHTKSGGVAGLVTTVIET